MNEQTNIDSWFPNQLSFDIWNKKYRYNNESLDKWFERVSGGNEELEKRIREKKFLFAGRILANRGIENKGTYSNCYSRGFVEDNLIDIMKVATDLALTYKAEGGQGVSLSKIRPKGASIRGLYESDGIVPWMELYNTVTQSISQGGSRKGALLISLDITHKEAETFITIKDDLSRITRANLSLEISDDFMDNVKYNGRFEVTGHYGGNKLTYEVNPKHLYNLLVEHAWKSGEPGVIFSDMFRNYNLMQYVDEYSIETCNPCNP